MLLYTLIQVAAVFVGVFLSQNPSAGMEEVFEGLMKITGIAALAAIPIMSYFFIADNKKEGIRILDYVRETKAADYLMIAAFGAGSALLLNMLIAVSGLSRYDEKFSEISELIYAEGWFVLILMAGIIIPIAEELIFRALIYKRLRRGYGIGFALVISSLLFGIFHGNLVQGVYAFLLGLLLALIYEKWENIYLCMLYHMAANTSSLLLSFFAEAAQGAEADPGANPAYVGVLLVILVFCVLFSVLGIRYILRHERADVLRMEEVEKKEEKEFFVEDILEAERSFFERD